jgi:hypothetical protein
MSCADIVQSGFMSSPIEHGPSEHERRIVTRCVACESPANMAGDDGWCVYGASDNGE